MDKALNYMNTYWKQLTAWRKDGRYDIDNTLAYPKVWITLPYDAPGRWL